MAHHQKEMWQKCLGKFILPRLNFKFRGLKKGCKGCKRWKFSLQEQIFTRKATGWLFLFLRGLGIFLLRFLLLFLLLRLFFRCLLLVPAAVLVTLLAIFHDCHQRRQWQPTRWSCRSTRRTWWQRGCIQQWSNCLGIGPHIDGCLASDRHFFPVSAPTGRKAPKSHTFWAVRTIFVVDRLVLRDDTVDLLPSGIKEKMQTSFTDTFPLCRPLIVQLWAAIKKRRGEWIKQARFWLNPRSTISLKVRSSFSLATSVSWLLVKTSWVSQAFKFSPDSIHCFKRSDFSCSGWSAVDH